MKKTILLIICISVLSIYAYSDFELLRVRPVVFSPNGDGINDEVTFLFENPKESAYSGMIYDITGRVIANMAKSDDSLVWDGKDSDGYVADKGIYIYQINSEGKIINGIVILAK